MIQVALFIGSLVSTAILTGLVRRFALRQELLDVPNARSSHSRPTPRGGGIAVVVVSQLSWLLACIVDAAVLQVVLPMVVGGTAVAAIGYIDDRSDVPPAIRGAVHVAAAICIVSGIGYADQLTTPAGLVELGAIGAILTVLFIVWLLNLTNFMDGIDAIAAVETMTVTLPAAVLLAVAGDMETATLCIVIGASACGFLAWNWPPAKIFLGDVGSGYLGFVIGSLAVISHVRGSLDIVTWCILGGAFIVDATYTLLQRLIRNQRIYEAHRSHAYQHAALKFASHTRVSLAFAAINIFWLMPLAMLVFTGRIDNFVGLAIAYLPLVVAAAAMGAGRE